MAYLILMAAYLVTLLSFVIFLSARDTATMRFWLDVSHYSGPMVSALLLYLIATFYHNDKNPPLWINLCIVVSVMPLLSRDLFGFMDTVTFIPNSLGNIVLYRKSVLSCYFYLHTFIILSAITILFIIKIRTIKIRRLRKLSIFLLIMTGLTWILGVPFHFIIPHIFKGYGIMVPATGYLFYSIMLFALFYAVFRYSFMKMNVSFTIDNIMRKISDCILITDTEGNIVQVNEAARIMFSLPDNGQGNRNIKQVFPGLMTPDSGDNEIALLMENNSGFRKVPHPLKQGQVLDVSAEPVGDSFGDFIGILIICRTNDKLENARRVYKLTSREIEIIRFLYEGLEYQEIAGRLGLSMNTVRNHVQNIYAKTGAKNKAVLLKAVF
jgi:DNA-binding CsgD family transcriptional regulator